MAVNHSYDLKPEPTWIGKKKIDKVIWENSRSQHFNKNIRIIVGHGQMSMARKLIEPIWHQTDKAEISFGAPKGSSYKLIATQHYHD